MQKSNEYTYKWWLNMSGEKYFTKFSFFFSYENMDRFNLKDARILEVGFGYGREISQFCKLSKNVTGIDFSNNNIALTYENLKNIDGIKGAPALFSYENIGYDPEFPISCFTVPNCIEGFDFIYSCFVIQHMSKHNAVNLVRDSLANAKDGIVFFEFYGSPSFLVDYEFDAYSDGVNGKMYNNAYNADQIRRLVYDAGGRIEILESWGMNDEVPNYWVGIKNN